MTSLIWTQWNDLELPKGVQHAATNGIEPNEGDLSRIEFFVPLYMGGASSLKVIQSMTSLKVIQSLNAGVDDLLPICPPQVQLCNAAGVHDDSTAELALGLAIAARRGFIDFARNQFSQTWDHKRYLSLTDSKVAIVGYGNIGKRIASLLSVFNVEVTTFSRSGRDKSLKLVQLDFLLPTFDVVILILPLSEQTVHFMDARRLDLLKDGATLVNVARGAVIDTHALIEELKKGRISAALDVTDPEPLPPTHELWGLENLIITPHVGGDSQAFLPRGRKLVQDQVKRFANGEPLLNVVSG